MANSPLIDSTHPMYAELYTLNSPMHSKAMSPTQMLGNLRIFMYRTQEEGVAS